MMRKTKRQQRFLSLALCLCMLASILPLSGMTYAAGADCNHVHNDACGYVEGAAGADCAHVHDEDCGGLTGGEPVPCGLTDGCTLPDGHEGGCASGAPLLGDLSAESTSSYTWNAENGTLTVHTDQGFAAFKEEHKDDWSESIRTAIIDDAVTQIPEDALKESSLSSLQLGAKVQSIGANAFSMTKLTTVTLPASVTSVGDGAFAYCDALPAIQVAEGNSAYTSQDGVLFTTDMGTLVQYPGGKTATDYTVPDSVETIAERAFVMGNGVLRNITLPADITVIGDYAFSVYRGTVTLLGKTPPTLKGDPFYSVSAIYVPADKVAEYKKATGWNDYASKIFAPLTDEVETDDYKFERAAGRLTVKTSNGATAWKDDGIVPIMIKSVTVAADVTQLDDYAFQNCSNLTTVDLGGVTSLGCGAFMSCTSLTDIDLRGVTTLDNYTFQNCFNLTTVDLGSVTSLGHGAFMSCTSLINIDLSGVTTLGQWAFAYCTSLLTVDLSSVNSVKGNPFLDCESLTAITVNEENKNFTAEDGVLYTEDKTRLICYPIGRAATEFTVPDTVKKIDDCAFQKAVFLRHVRFQSAEAQTVYQDTFRYCSSDIIFHVPNREAYRNVPFALRTVYAPPAVPTNVTARQVGVNGAMLTWTAPEDTLPEITGYTVSWDNGNKTTELPATANSHTVTGLLVGDHTFAVRAVNAEDKSAAAETTVEIQEVEEWDGSPITDNSTLLLNSEYTGVIEIPQNVTTLTIDGQGNPFTGVHIKCADGYTGVLNLTLVNLNLNLTAPDNKSALYLPKETNLTVVGKNAITATNVNCHAITIVGAETPPAAVTLSLPGAGDTLTLNTNGFGINSTHTTLTLNNNGTVSIESAAAAIFAGGIGTLTVNGTGALYAHSMNESALIANGDGGVTLNGGRVVAVGKVAGITSQGSVTINQGVTGLAAGLLRDGIISLKSTVANNSPAFLAVKGAAEIEKNPLDSTADLLDLSRQTEPKVWTNLNPESIGDGFAVWTPAADGQPARLLLEKAYLGDCGLRLPSGNAALLFAGGENTVSNISGATDLTLQNLGAQAAMLKAMGNSDSDAGTIPPAIAATGSVTFVGGAFEVRGNIAPRANLTAGELTMISSGVESGSTSSQTLTVTPNPVAARAALSANYARAEAGADADSAKPILGGAFTDSRTYTGADGYIHALISPRNQAKSLLTVVNGTGGGEYDLETLVTITGTGSGTFTGWTPIDNVTDPSKQNTTYLIPFDDPAEYTVTANYTTDGGGGDDSVSTYAVVYKANYANAPKDIRDSGHASGANVTLKAGSIFAAPTDKTFAGWAESASGAAKYQGGEQIKMPSGTLTLYAVWRDGEAIPGLNRTDHLSYLQGYPDGRAGPNDLITREQTAMIFYRLLDEKTRSAYETTRHAFPDVAAGRWSETAIATLANAGIVIGQNDGNFAPDRSITRAEFATIAARFDSDSYDGPDLFPDIAGHWAREQINHAAQKGWVDGTGNGRFEPDRPITRAEAAALINRVLGRAPETADDLLPGMRIFADNLDQTAWYYLDIQEAANSHEYDRKADGVHERWTELTD